MTPSTPPAAPPPLPAPLAEPTPVWREYAAAVGIVALSTALCFVLRSRLKTVDVAMVLLLGGVAGGALFSGGGAARRRALRDGAGDVDGARTGGAGRDRRAAHRIRVGR